MPRGVLSRDRKAAILRGVVGDDDLEGHMRLGDQRVQGPAYEHGPVVDGQPDAHEALDDGRLTHALAGHRAYPPASTVCRAILRRNENVFTRHSE